MAKHETEITVESYFTPTIDNAIRDMKLSKELFLTKNKKFHSCVAKDYIEDKKRVLPFIREELREEFIVRYNKIFQDVGNESDEYIAYRLQNMQFAGEIMMLLNDNTDWALVDKTLKRQGHSGGTMSLLIHTVIYYSKYGLDLLEHVYGINARKQAEEQLSKP